MNDFTASLVEHMSKVKHNAHPMSHAYDRISIGR